MTRRKGTFHEKNYCGTGQYGKAEEAIESHDTRTPEVSKIEKNRYILLIETRCKEA